MTPTSSPPVAAGHDRTCTSIRPPLLWILGILLFWLLALGLGLPWGQVLQWGGDEGIELNKAAFWNAQRVWPLDAWNDQPLTHTRWYAWLMAGTVSPTGPRLWSLLCGAMLLAAVGRIAFVLCLGSTAIPCPADAARRSWAARVAGASVACVALCPTFSELSLSAMQEIPATAWGMVAIAGVVVPSGGGGRSIPRWQMWFAAVSAALAISIKLTAGLYAVVAWALLLGMKSTGRSAVSGAPGVATEKCSTASNWNPVVSAVLWGVLVVTLAVGFLRVLDGRGLTALLGSHLRAFSGSVLVEATGSPERWHQMLREYPEFVIWTVVGALAAWSEFRGRLAAVWRWMLLPLLALGWNGLIQPWWPYYTLSLWLGLAPFAGLGWVWTFEQFRAGLRGVSSTRWSLPVTVALGGLVLAAGASAVWSWGREFATWRQHPRAADSPIVRTLQRYAAASAHGTTYSADPIYPFWCGLPTPAPLLVVTRKRFLSGDVDQAAILRQVRESHCDFLIFVQDSGPSVREVWGDFVKEHYVLTMVSEGRELYVHRRLHPEPFATTLHW